MAHSSLSYFSTCLSRLALIVLSFALSGSFASASHFRGSSASYVLDDSGILSVEVFSAWRSSFIEAPNYEVWTGPGSTGTLIGVMTLSDTIDPFSMGTELGGASFTVRKDTFTFDMSSRPLGTYYARWTRGNRVAGINNVPNTRWSSEMTVLYAGMGPGTGNGSPALPPATIDVIGQGFPYAQNLNAIDPDGTPVIYQFIGGTNGGGASAPDYGPATDIPGLVLGTVTGLVNISGLDTAALGQGRWAYKIRATDGNGATAERDVLIVVENPMTNVPPVLNAIGPQTISINNLLQFGVVGSDANVGELVTVRGTTLPAGATFPQTSSFSPTSSTFSWTPPSGAEGTYQVFFEAFDDDVVPLIDSELVEITVTGPNSPPSLNGIGDQVVANGGSLMFPISATDPDGGQMLTYEAFFLPAGATFNSGTQTFTWTPSLAQYDETFVGITFRVTDDGIPNLFDEESITIAVGAGNFPPAITPISPQVVITGQQIQFMVTATDGNPAQTLSLSGGSGGLPAGATFPTISGVSPQNSTFTWTPLPAQVGLTIVNFLVVDNGIPPLSFEFPVAVQVNDPPNEAPVLAAIGNLPVANNTLLSFSVSATDPNLGDMLTYSAVGLPPGATFNPGTQIFSWIPSTPAQDDETFTGVTFRVTDDGDPTLLDEETITITVGAGNQQPVIAPIAGSPFTIDSGQLLSFTVDATDSSAVQIVTISPGTGGLPTGATLPIVSGNTPVSTTFTWIPTAAQTGLGQVFFFAADDNGTPPMSAFEQSVTINVNLGVNNPPQLNAIGDRSVANNTLLSFMISGTDPDILDTLTYSASGLPAGATFNPGTQTFSWTPSSPSQDDETFTDVVFTVTDDGIPNFSHSETISITVGAGNQPPVFAPIAGQPLTVVVGQQISFNVDVTDSSTTQLVTLAPGTGGLPAGASFPASLGTSPVSRTFNWTPIEAQIGQIIVNFSADDNGTPPMSAVELPVTIEVQKILAPPSILIPPSDSSTIYNAEASFSVIVAGEGTLTFQWKRNGIDIFDGAKYSGTQTSLLRVMSVTNADEASYSCVVTNQSSVTSADGQLTVLDPGIATQPADTAAIIGTSATFSVVTSGSGALTYQWYKDGSPATPLANLGGEIAGATSPTLTILNAQNNPPAQSDEGDYYVEITGTDPGIVQSDLANLMVGNPVIIAHPSPVDAEHDATAWFEIEVIGTPPLFYQWQKNGVNVQNGGRFSGADTPMLTISAVEQSDVGDYSCVVIGINIEQSNAASLTVETGLRFDNDLQDDIAEIGSTFSWKVTILDSVGPLTYQWFKDDGAKTLQPLTNGGNIFGADSDTLIFFPALPSDEGQYRVDVFDSLDVAVSRVARLQIVAELPIRTWTLALLLGALVVCYVFYVVRRAKGL